MLLLCVSKSNQDDTKWRHGQTKNSELYHISGVRTSVIWPLESEARDNGNWSSFLDLRTVHALKNKIEYSDFGFFDLYCINVSVITLTAQRTEIDVYAPLLSPSLSSMTKNYFIKCENANNI